MYFLLLLTLCCVSHAGDALSCLHDPHRSKQMFEAVFVKTVCV